MQYLEGQEKARRAGDERHLRGRPSCPRQHRPGPGRRRHGRDRRPVHRAAQGRRQLQRSLPVPRGAHAVVLGQPRGEAVLLLRLRRRWQPVRVRAGQGEPRLRGGRRVSGRQVRHRAGVRGVERSRRCGASPPRAPARPSRTGDGLLRAGAARRGGGGAGPRVPQAARPWRRRLPPVPSGLQPRGLGQAARGGARPMGDEKPKYLTSPETPLYHKSEAVFGLHAAKAAAGREDRVYVVEGYTDVLALVQAGVHNVVASMGTALTEQQLKRLARVTRNLYLCFDADAAGLGAMSRALTLGRKMGLSLHVVRVPDGLDPADYVLSGAGGEGFRALAADAQTLLQFHVRLALATHDLDKPDGRARAFAQLKGVLSEAATPIERDEELRHVADRLQLSDESVRYLLAGSGRSARAGDVAGEGRSQAPQGGGAAAAVGGAHELEVRFLAGCLAQPQKGRAVLAGVDESFFATAETRAALRVVKARLEREGAGNTLQTAAKAADDDDDGETLAEVVVRAGRERFTATVVDELFLRLQEAHVSRLIARLKVTAKTDESGKQGAELIRLQAVRRTVRGAIRTIPVDEEPDEG